MGNSVSVSGRSTSNGGGENDENGGGYDSGDVLYRRMEGLPLGFHYGVYIGRNEVIHFAARENTAGEGIIEKVTLNDFSNGREINVQRNFHRKRMPKKRTATKAMAMYFQNEDEEDWQQYNWRTNNCEHFAQYCATGMKYSSQTNFIPL